MSQKKQPAAVPTAVWELGSSIVKEIAPNELEDYALLVDSYAHAASIPRSKRSDSDRFGFGVETEFVLISGHILAGLLAMFEMFVASRRIRHEKLTADQLRDAWTRFLMKQGLSRELAEAIPARNAAEMLRILEAAATHEQEK